MQEIELYYLLVPQRLTESETRILGKRNIAEFATPRRGITLGDNLQNEFHLLSFYWADDF